MIDTVCLGYNFDLDDATLSHLFQRRFTKPNGEVRYKWWLAMDLRDERQCKIAFYPQDRFGGNRRLFMVEFSAPMMLYGNNIQMATDMDQIVNVANEYLGTIPGIPRIDVSEGEIVRIDLCFNHMVGDSVTDYIKYLGSLNYLQRKTVRYAHEGVEYVARSAKTKFYDKWLRAKKNDTAKGMLRQEQQLRDIDDIRSMGGVKPGERPTITCFNMENVKTALQRDLVRLKITDELVTNQDAALKRLTTAYKQKKADMYFSYLTRKQTNDVQSLSTIYGRTSRTFTNWEKLVTAAGVSLSLQDSKVTLPGLAINFEMA